MQTGEFWHYHQQAIREEVNYKGGQWKVGLHTEKTKQKKVSPWFMQMSIMSQTKLSLQIMTKSKVSFHKDTNWKDENISSSEREISYWQITGNVKQKIKRKEKRIPLHIGLSCTDENMSRSEGDIFYS